MAVYVLKSGGKAVFFIFGFDSGHKFLGVSNGVCPACVRATQFHISKEYSVFTFFFIPLIPYNISYFAHCPECGSVMALSQEKGKAFERDPSVVIYDGDLQILQNNAGPTCPSCQAQIIVNQNFCYHCGTKLL